MSASRRFRSVLERASVSIDPTSGRRLPGRPLYLLGLSTRAHNAVRRGGIHTIEDLARWQRDDLLRIRNLGEVSVQEILDAVHRFLHQ